MNIIKICKNTEEIIDFGKKYDIVDWLSNDNQLTLVGDEHGIEINQNTLRGFCKFCKQYKGNFLFVHENVYCHLNLNKDEEYVKQFKLNEKKRQQKCVVCCCGKSVSYSSLSKHRLSKYHIKNS
jgi:hypothetical protein